MQILTQESPLESKIYFLFIMDFKKLQNSELIVLLALIMCPKCRKLLILIQDSLKCKTVLNLFYYWSHSNSTI